MTLVPGTRLGSYEVTAKLGEGGMGEVYRATDSRLGRQVAIKVLPVSLAHDGDRLARFDLEARTLAALNHPNIAALHGLERIDSTPALVMELVEGPTLAERIAKGPLPIEEASSIGGQVADALDYAHERGIVHRDVKPGNVKIRPDGVVKVLDFGIAKAIPHGSSPPDDLPTQAVPQTALGTIVGTTCYMSPEQIAGKEADKRADIWAFGCMFYEMLTGRPPFHGGTSQETMASILRDEPDLTKVPPKARGLLKRCLEKDPQKRLRHIGDVMALLEESPPSSPSAPAPAISKISQRRVWLPLAAAVAVLGVALAVWWSPWREPASRMAAAFEITPTEEMQFFYGAAMSVSPDGRWLVFPAIGKDGEARYWIRALDSFEARPLPGTEKAYVPAGWSWDSRYVIFNTLNDSRLRRVAIQGGPPQPLAEAGGGLNGLTASDRGDILFGTTGNRPILRMPAEGGSPVPVTALAPGDSGHKFPQFLPDGRRFLYLRISSDPNVAGVYVGSVDAKPDEQSAVRLLASNRQAYHATSADGASYLIFMRDTTLMARPFDPAALALTGDAAPIAENVDSFAGAWYGLFAVSNTGALAFVHGVGSKIALIWFDENGNPEPALGEPGDYMAPSVAPHSGRIAVSRGVPPNRDIVTVDAARNITTPVTFHAADDFSPVWSPDGKYIVFASARSRVPKMYIKPADGSSEERILIDMPGVPTSWSRDGRFLLFENGTAENGTDIWIVADPLGSQGAPKASALQATKFNEAQAQFSPDGRWIAYTSDESSATDVWVRSFEADGNDRGSAVKVLVSAGGLNSLPRWQPDGARLFYTSAATFGVMAVDVDTRTGFTPGKPRRIFTAPPPLLPVGWAVAADGKRFLFATTPGGGKAAPFRVSMDWAAALEP